MKQSKQSVFSGAMTLMVSTAIVHLIGLLYKIPITALIGEVGRGYFTSAYELYTPVYAISMAGLPVAVSKMVSERLAKGKYNEVLALRKISKQVFLITGFIGTVGLIALSYPLTHYVIKTPESIYSVIAIAPSIFFCCLISSYRGYFEGFGNMKPTGISQIIETLGKLVFGLGLALYITKDVNLAVAPFSAAASIFGVTLGTVVSLIYLAFKFKMSGNLLPREAVLFEVDKSDLRSKLIKTAIPIATSSLVLNITNLIDSITIQGRLNFAINNGFHIINSIYPEIERAGIARNQIKSFLYGCYGVGLDFRNIIPTMVMTLGVSAIPVLSSSFAVGDKRSTLSAIHTVIKIGALISSFAGFMLAFYSKEILSFLYSGTNSESTVTIATPIVSFFGLFAVIFSMSSPTTNMLQAIGRSDVPIKSLIVGASAKIILNYILVSNPKININGAPIGSVVCCLIIFIINIHYLIKETNTKINWIKNMLIPIAVSAISACFSKLFYLTFMVLFEKYGFITHIKTFNLTSISCLLSIIFGLIIWLILLFTFEILSENEKKHLFIGKKTY